MKQKQRALGELGIKERERKREHDGRHIEHIPVWFTVAVSIASLYLNSYSLAEVVVIVVVVVVNMLTSS